MSRHVFRLPDLGEGTVEAELVAWHVSPGDLVREDQVIAEVMTEKAAVELPSPVAGRVVTVRGTAGDMLRVGEEFIVFEVDVAASAPPPAKGGSEVNRERSTVSDDTAAASGLAPTLMRTERPTGAARVAASPATRRLARELGVDLRKVQGSGPGGRIRSADLEIKQPSPAKALADVDEIQITGLRRIISERMSESNRTIPHFSYVEEIDITQLESLRARLNEKIERDAPQLGYLPFIVSALVRALERTPQCNARYDASRNVVVRHRAVHVGIATQTPEGLLVPVLRHAERLSIAQIAEQIRSLADRARSRKSSREELSGSTITISSLGKLGGVASTPVINPPEVAIVGVNNATDRAVVSNGVVLVRRMMNLSSAFDHRFVDGHDAATMIQELKTRLEHPALIFMP